MGTIEESIDVGVSVSTASEQWTEFDSFPNDAEVTFLELDEQSTRVIVQMAYEPHGLNEPVGNVVGIGERRLTDELESFKVFIEQRAA
jgi:uncharacterized membrane protein